MSRVDNRNAAYRTEKDHPHSRGKNPAALPVHLWCDGPSPLAWEEPAPDRWQSSYARTIPTRVGRTLPTLRVCSGVERFGMGSGLLPNGDHHGGLHASSTPRRSRPQAIPARNLRMR